MASANTDNSTASNLSSRLLQLPLELKTQIFTYVLGGQCIHVEPGNARSFRLFPCRATATTASAQQLFNAATDIDPVRVVGQNHREYSLDAETDDDADEKPNTSFFVCVDTHRRCYRPDAPGISQSCMTTRRARMPPIENLMRPRRTMQTERKPWLCLRGEGPPDPWAPSDLMPLKPKGISLPFHVLRTCRQIYHEMSHIVYSENTFSFQAPDTLIQFASRKGSNPLAVRRIHLHMDTYNESEENEWNRALRTATHRFKNLCSVDISIDQAIWNCTYPHKDRKTPSMTAENTFLTNLSELKKLKFLRTMTLVVTDVYPWQAWERSQFLWSTAQKQQWARDIRRGILGNG